jgi:hypothetical protein
MEMRLAGAAAVDSGDLFPPPEDQCGGKVRWPAARHEKELVLLGVVMPHELTLELDYLYVGVVQRTDDLWRPVVGDPPKLVPLPKLLAWARAGR